MTSESCLQTSWRPPEYLDLLERAVATARATSADAMPRHSLKQCINLAPAHTGSTSLYKLLHQFSPHLAHHRHQYDLAHLFSRYNASCFIMTLREPTQRYLSA